MIKRIIEVLAIEELVALVMFITTILVWGVTIGELMR